MALIEFKDFPNTETPIDSENLNHNFNELDNATKNGWNRLKTTFTFVSWDSTTYTGVVSTNIDLTAYLTAGMKIKLTQNSAVKYAFITAITSTQITLFMGTDYTLTNGGITDAYYSIVRAPYGFPLNPDKWTIKFTSNTLIQNEAATNETWWNLTNCFLDVPIGNWELSYNSYLYVKTKSANVYVVCRSTLSTANNSESDTEYTCCIGYDAASSILSISGSQLKTKSINLTVKTPYYLNYSGFTGAGTMIIGNTPELKYICIKAICSYL